MTPEIVGTAVGLTAVLLVAARAAAARERIVAALGEPLTVGAPLHAVETARLPRWLEATAPFQGRSLFEHAPTFVAAALVSALVGHRLVGPVGAVAGLVGGTLAVRLLARARADRVRIEAERQLGEFVEAAAAAVRAGLSVRRALREASRDVDPPLRPTLDAVRDALDVGEPLERAFERLAPAVGSRDARRVAALHAVHARTGGDLPRLLDDVAEIVRHRIEGLRSVRTLTAQGRASGAVLAVLPVAFVALLSWTSGDGLGAFYRTPLGATLVSAGLLCEGLGFLWIRRIVEAPLRER